MVFRSSIGVSYVPIFTWAVARTQFAATTRCYHVKTCVSAWSLKMVPKKVGRSYSRRAKSPLGSIGRFILSIKRSRQVSAASPKNAYRGLKINEPLLLDPPSRTSIILIFVSRSPRNAHRGDMRATFLPGTFWKNPNEESKWRNTTKWWNLMKEKEANEESQWKRNT